MNDRFWLAWKSTFGERDEETSLEQAFRHIFKSCSNGAAASTTVETNSSSNSSETQEEDDEDCGSVSLNRDEKHPHTITRTNPRPMMDNYAPPVAANNVRSRNRVAMENYQAMDLQDRDDVCPAKYQVHRTKNQAPLETNQLHPSSSNAPLSSRTNNNIKKKTYTSNQEIGDHIYEHLFLRQQKQDDPQIHLGITPPRFAPAATPKEETATKYLTIRNTISEDEISAISSYTLDAMAIERSISRDSYHLPGTKRLQRPLHTVERPIYDTSTRYGTPHSRSTTTSSSFDQWQTAERKYWKSQLGDASTATSTRPEDLVDFAEL